MKRIGVFGGTFNPPHIGHSRLVEHIRQTVSLDRLLVIPREAKESPGKASASDFSRRALTAKLADLLATISK